LPRRGRGQRSGEAGSRNIDFSAALLGKRSVLRVLGAAAAFAATNPQVATVAKQKSSKDTYRERGESRWQSF